MQASSIEESPAARRTKHATVHSDLLQVSTEGTFLDNSVFSAEGISITASAAPLRRAIHQTSLKPLLLT